MTDTANRIRQIEEELARLPAGYISKKMISGKERFYLQWMENGKLKSKYIKAADFDRVNTQVETRKRLQAELKALKNTPEGIRETNLKRKTAKKYGQPYGRADIRGQGDRHRQKRRDRRLR